MNVHSIDSLKKIQDKGVEHAIVLIHSKKCHHCVQYKPVYENVSSSFPEFTFYCAEAENLPDDEISAIKNKTGPGVPVTIYMKDGKYVDAKKGNVDEGILKNWLNDIPL
jgi:thioredoxin-like negative regulator of GroEL